MSALGTLRAGTRVYLKAPSEIGRTNTSYLVVTDVPAVHPWAHVHVKRERDDVVCCALRKQLSLQKVKR